MSSFVFVVLFWSGLVNCQVEDVTTETSSGSIVSRILGDLISVFNNSTKTTPEMSHRRNVVVDNVEIDFSPWKPSNWKPVRQAKKARLDKESTSTQKSTTVFNGPRTTPFVASPQLSPSGWLPVSNTKPPRKGKKKPVEVDYDYDDIITAPPPRDNFEVVVGANLNSGPKGRIKIVPPPKLERVRRATRTALPTGKLELESLLRSQVLTPVYVPRSGIDVDRFITRQPVSINYGLWNKKSLPDAFPTVVYVPVRKLTSRPTNIDYPMSEKDVTSTKGNGANTWRESVINTLFTLPPVSYELPMSRQDTHSTRRLIVDISTPASRSETILDVQPIMNNPQNTGIFTKTHRGPYTVRAYTTTTQKSTTSTTTTTTTTFSLNYSQDFEVKGLLGGKNSQNGDGLVVVDNKNSTSEENSKSISTTNLTYILVGTCCGLSILCLLVVVITIRRKRKSRQNLGNFHQNAELINGWESVNYPKSTELGYENNLLRIEDGGNSQMDPWFDKKPILPTNSKDLENEKMSANQPGTIMAPNGIRFETLGVGPIKEIKRTTVIPAKNTAFLTDGHCNVMRELSSISSTGSINSGRSLCSGNLLSYQQIESDEVGPESLDIPVELFDTNNSTKSTSLGKNGGEGRDEILWTSNDERLI